MRRTTFLVILGLFGLLVVGGLVLNAQRDRAEQARQAARAAEARLPADIAGCGKGTGRWGGRLHESRDAATGAVLGRSLLLDNSPEPGESEAVLQAWLACHRQVGQDLQATVGTSTDRPGRYYRITDDWGYFVQDGYISCLALGGRTRCALPPR
jgi:hypothetical protein